MTRAVKLFLHHRYRDVESGPAAVVGRGKLRLQFIPFQFATPTYGDVVAAKRDPEFERNWAFEVPRPRGMDVEDLAKHGGRYTMVVEFHVRGERRGPWFPGRRDIVSSVMVESDETRPGIIFFAVPDKLEPPEVMKLLGEGHRGFRFELVHPKPRARRARRRTRR